jgi:hypothetical protein
VKPTILIFIEHDIIIRHFILSRTFLELESHYDVRYVISKGRRVQANIGELALGESQPILLPLDNNRLSLYRKLYRTTLLRNIRLNPDYKSTRDVWRAIVGDREINKRTLLSYDPLYGLYKRYISGKLGEDEGIKDVIMEMKPSLIIHPTVLEGVFVSDLIMLGKKFKVPTLYIMNSWDNPSTKAMMLGFPDWLLVWGEQSRNHAKKFLGIPDQNIVCFGSAQFEAYHKKPFINKNELLKYLKLGEETKIIMYAGSSNGFEEIDQLEILEGAIREKRLPNCHIIFRPHPWRGSRMKERNFFACNFKYVSMDPYMVDCYEISRIEEKPSIYYKADYEKMNAILKSSDMVVSGISSVMLEAVTLGIPVVCSTFDKYIDMDPFLDRVSKMYHFQEFFNYMKIERVKNEGNFIDSCVEALNNSEKSEYRNMLKKRSEFFVNQYEDPYSDRLLRFVNQILMHRS